MSQEQSDKADLVHVHQCSSCGRLSSPEQFSSRANIRGVYECPFCRFSEALNVKIVRRAELEQQS